MSYPPPGPGYNMYGPPQGYGGMPQPGGPPMPHQPAPLGFANMGGPPPSGGGMPMPMPGPAPPAYPGMMPPAPGPGMPMPPGPGMPMAPAAPPPHPGYGPPPPAPMSFGTAAMATTAFPSHYRAMQTGGPPMPQAFPQYNMPSQPPVSAYSYQPTASTPPPPSQPSSSAYSYQNTASAPQLASQPSPSTGASTTAKPSARHGRPSVVEYKPFDAKKDANVLRKAMKGLGCDNKAITYLLCSRTNPQRQRIALEYKTMHGRDLMKDLKSELGGHFEDTVVALLTLPAEYDATLLRKSIKGLGTDEAVLIEIMTTRTNNEMIAIKSAYTKLFSRDLEKDISGDTSGHFRKFLISLANANRLESDYVDITKAQQDAQALYKAGEGRWGTNESKFNSILASRSFAQLRAIFGEYSKISKYDIEDSIKREMSGDLRDGMATIVRVVRNAPAYFAEKLHKSMKGLGTDDKTLIRVVVTRSEVDMLEIRDEFHKMYGTSLGRFIADDTKGNYKKILLQLVGEPV